MIRLALAVVLLLMATSTQAQPLSPYASAGVQQQAMRQGRVSSEQLVQAALTRIAEVDRAGPTLNSVIAVNRHALADARRLDAERKAGKVRGPLHGVPVLLKDNIESWDDTATTAGSLALAGNIPGRDATVVRRLTDAGAVILGKANLSEWANFRSGRSISGWSAVGGLVRNPHSLDRSACGSSAGSAVAVAAGLATVSLGTETDGSVVCPAALNGIVGLKPTLGLVPRTHIVPLSPEQDTAGPMARTVADAAAVLTAIAGSDKADPATAEADRHKRDYAKALDPRALRGARIGVWQPARGRSPGTDAVFDAALEALKAQGAVLVPVTPPEPLVTRRISQLEGASLHAEFRASIDAYLATTPPAVKTRTLEALIAFNAATPRELALFGQDVFEAAAKAPPLSDPAYQAGRAEARRLARQTLDRMLEGVDVVIAPGGGPAWVVDPVAGDRFIGPSAMLAAVSGYPHLTVPMGAVEGLPVGLSFYGRAWSEDRLLALGYAFEQATHARLDPEFRGASVDHPAFAPVAR